MPVLSNRRQFLGLAAAAAVTGLCAPLALRSRPVIAAQAMPVRPEFFGLHMVWPVRSPYPSHVPPVPVGAWRANLPELHWFGLEPRQGEWRFGKFDTALPLMQKQHVDVLYTFGECPTWASSDPTLKGPYIPGQLAPPRRLADWEAYVRAVAERYRGRIRHYELWNEPAVREVDGQRAHFSAGQLVELGQAAYRIIKQVDPRARLTTPAMVGAEKGIDRMEAYLAAGGNQCSDIVSFHFYGLPEQIPQYYTALRRVMARHGVPDLPIWNTEYGYLIKDPTTPNTHPLIGGAFARVLPATEAAAWLGRSLIIAASLGIERFYWHMWDGKDMGLITFKEKRINAAGVAWGAVANWLTGRVPGPVQQDGNVVSCALTNNGAIVGHLLWTRDYKPMRWAVPTNWGAAEIAWLDGRRRALARAAQVQLGAAPVLIRSAA